MAGENRRCSRRMEMESGCCGFCHLREQNEITGELYKSKDGSLCAHFNCMLFSSGLVQPNTPNINELGGFCLEDIKKEIKRGWKLKCSECKEAGATIGCDIKICKKTFHYQCAKNCKAEFFEDEDRGVYKLYCRIHSKNNSEDTLNNDGDQVETDKENKTEDDTTDDDQLDIMSIVSGGDDTNDEDFSLPEVHCADNNRGTPGINRNEKRNNLEECTGQQKEKEKCSDSELGETFTRSLSHRLEFTDTGPPKKQAKLATTGSTEKSTETTNPPNAKPEAMLMHEQPLQEPSNIKTRLGHILIYLHAIKDWLVNRRLPLNIGKTEELASGQSCTSPIASGSTDTPLIFQHFTTSTDSGSKVRAVDVSSLKMSHSLKDILLEHVMRIAEDPSGHTSLGHTSNFSDWMNVITLFIRQIGQFDDSSTSGQRNANIFWKSCREENCIDAVISKIKASLESLTQRISSGTASDEDHHQLFQVLLATGCLKDAVLKAKQEIRNKIQKIEDEKASLYKEEKALDAFLTKF
ncbi:PHD finger protein 11 isoform X1 [Rhinatrema bivittatum]|uniref:PHD finger protein 11 isoform X1 n=1 Tax=Rhinatrema bivittatum TaxID=194408 RepID=UPI0011262D5E|nr:PHD finger protein 11 isoform X1 [Rhinatrema bivittatum]